MREMTEAEKAAFYDKQKCPNCGRWEFLLGPRGGLSVNVMCARCGLRLNVCEVADFRFGQVLDPEPRGYIPPDEGTH